MLCGRRCASAKAIAAPLAGIWPVSKVFLCRSNQEGITSQRQIKINTMQGRSTGLHIGRLTHFIFNRNNEFHLLRLESNEVPALTTTLLFLLRVHALVYAIAYNASIDFILRSTEKYAWMKREATRSALPSTKQMQSPITHTHTSNRHSDTVHAVPYIEYLFI